MSTLGPGFQGAHNKKFIDLDQTERTNKDVNVNDTNGLTVKEASRLAP